MLESHRIIPATRLVRNPNFDIRFPPLPRTVAEVNALIAQELDAPDTKRLIEIVNTDPVVAGSVLRRINSAYYGIRRRVGSIEKAVRLLGFDEVCDIVMTAGLLKLQDVLRSDEQTRIFQEIMLMSVGAASYCKRLAASLDLEQQQSTFTLGLIHTCGRLVLLYNRPDDYEALWCTNDFGFAPTVVSEQIIFGTDHAELGAQAAEHWHFPEYVNDVIRHYLTPGHLNHPAMRVLALTLSVSVTATERLCMAEGGRRTRFEPNAALHALARSRDVDVSDLVALLVDDADEVKAYMHAMVDTRAD